MANIIGSIIQINQVILIVFCIVFSTTEVYSEQKPEIESVSVEKEILHGETAATLKAVIAGDTKNISRVWAEITSLNYNTDPWNNPTVPSVELDDTDNDRTYKGLYNEFTATGIYIITFYAVNKEGISSLAKYATVTQEGEADDYEEDDTLDHANVIVINDDIPQLHYFHNIGDEDWVKFYGRSGQTYSIKAANLGLHCDPVIEVYDSDETSIPVEIIEISGEYRQLTWKCPEDGRYFVKVRNFNANIFGPETSYELKVFFPYSEDMGNIIGYVSDCCSGKLIADVNIRLVEKSDYSAISDSGENLGLYEIKHVDKGTCTLAVDGYESYLCEGDSCEVTVKYGETTTKDIYVCFTNLYRAILVLKVTAGITTDIDSLICFDEDNDKKISLADAVYILQKVSEIRK
ncbi:MAG: hypothetical protein GY795_08680 [Desulfobacterales bacterium]|nr:hypothetical protein [Desulfobacterales bacterium]